LAVVRVPARRRRPDWAPRSRASARSRVSGPAAIGWETRDERAV